MHRLFTAVVAPLLKALEPQTIVETGAGAGRLTRHLLEAKAARAAQIHVVDPVPGLDPAVVEEAADRLTLHEDRSVSALARIGQTDVALLDGDPNWFCVHSDLVALERAAERADRPAPLIFVHHVHWPYGRRDGYYDPAVIPESERRPYCDLGLVPGHREPRDDGLRIVPYCAVDEFEPRSGVLTAIDDAVSASERDWSMVEVPGFHGVAVLAEGALLAERPAVAEALANLRSAGFLGAQARRAESARLAAAVELAALGATGSAIAEESLADPVEQAARETAQARRNAEALAARVAELEAALARSDGDQEASPDEESKDSALPADEADQGEDELAPARDDAKDHPLLAELAEHRAQRSALEWRLEQIEEDLDARNRRIETIEHEREEQRRIVVESQVRLEDATGRLAEEREATRQLRERVAELEQEADRRASELRDALEREQLAQGRLAHREDALQAAQAESERWRAEVERLERELHEAERRLDEIADHLRGASMTFRARARRHLRRLLRPGVSAKQLPRPVEAALAVAEDKRASRELEPAELERDLATSRSGQD